MEDILFANGRKGVGKRAFKVDDDGISTGEIISNALEKVFYPLRPHDRAHPTVKQHVAREEKGQGVTPFFACAGKKKE